MNMTALWVKGSIFLNRQRDKLKEVFLDETGAVDIVAVVILIAIAVVLGVYFREQIVALVTGIWDKIDTSSINDPVSEK